MGFRTQFCAFGRNVALSAGLAALAGVALLTAKAAHPDNPSGDTVGTIEGDAISLQGPMTVEVISGQIKTILRSGNDVRVKSGQAHIDLAEGGQIAICGPAHLSVLKSGGSLTLALDSGVIHAHIEQRPALTIYTPQIQAKPIAIGDGPQDALIGFDTPGAMCVRATSGAVRLEQQLTGQNVIVPQGGDIILNNGALSGLRNTGGHCNCDMPIAKGSPPPPEYSRMATTEEIQKKDEEAKKEEAKKTAPPAEKPAAPAKEQPVYQVFMPPLSFDAKAAVQRDDFDPKMILLVRRVRVRPSLIYQGHVEGEPVATRQNVIAKTQVPPPHPTAPTATSSARVEESWFSRVRAFFRKLFS